MKYSARNQLRRFVAKMMTVVVTAATALIGTAGPASADWYTGFYYIPNEATNWYCLAADHHGTITAWPGCTGPQRWRFGHLSAYPGQFLLRNEVTDLCLMQFNWTRVIGAPCDGSRAEFRWTGAPGLNFISNVNTSGVLVADFDGNVNLYNDIPPANQRWYLPA